VLSKKLLKTVKIGMITNNEITKEDTYQKFILIIYNPPYKHESIMFMALIRKHLS
jgi:tRNA1(Val) A37 N6-methylase TrmN6